MINQNKSVSSLILSKSHILVYGMKGTVADFCKNIVLAGVGSVTLVDDRAVTKEALSANFLILPDENLYNGKTLAEVCRDSLKEFNPMVHVSVEKGNGGEEHQNQLVFGPNESQIPDALLERLLISTSEYPPVCAIVGGIVGQEVIKAISGKGDPLKNFFFFDAMDGKGFDRGHIEALTPVVESLRPP
ncbi:hypothetical protein GQ457_17G018230 [Hibiscus cannabinus]